MRFVPWLTLGLSFLLLAGCQKSSESPRKSITGRQPAAAKGNETEEAEIQAHLAKLDPEDQKLAGEQKFCAIQNDSRLGSMGTPVKLMLKDEPVFLCCKGCTKKAQDAPERTSAKAKQLRANDN